MINLSPKYEPLFDLPKARTAVNHKNFHKLPKERQKYWTDLSTVNVAMITGGRFSVKSFGVSTAVCLFANDYGHRVLFTRYTMTSAKDSIIPEFEEKIAMMGYGDNFEILKDRVTSKENKSKIIFKGIKTSSGNMTANLKSLKDFSCFVLDEGEEMPDFETWEKIMLSIRVTDVQNINIIIMNPATKEHWVHNKFFIENNVPEGFNGVINGVLYIHTTFKDCPREFIPDGIYEKFITAEADYNIFRETPKEQRELLSQKIIKNHKWYKHIVLGGWLDKAEGVIYEDWEFGEFDESLPHVYGLDFGSNDPDALTKVAVDYDALKIYVKEEYFKNNTSFDGLGRILKDRVGFEGLIIADAAERRMIRDYWDDGFNIKRCRKGRDSVKHGIKTLQGYTIIVEPNSQNVAKSLNNYVWHDSRAGVPKHDWSDIPDSFRYAAMYLIDY